MYLWNFTDTPIYYITSLEIALCSSENFDGETNFLPFTIYLALLSLYFDILYEIGLAFGLPGVGRKPAEPKPNQSIC